MSTLQSHVPGQQTLPDMAETMGYDTISLRPDEERFCWEYVRNGGHAVQAFIFARGVTEKTAKSHAYKMVDKCGVRDRIKQITDEIGRENMRKIQNSHGRTIDYDPLLFFKKIGNELVPRSYEEIPDELRCLCSVEMRVVDKELRTVLVPPDKFKAQVELAKMGGMYAAEKKELSGPDGADIPVKITVEFIKSEVAA